jgi:hypothetical protein
MGGYCGAIAGIVPRIESIAKKFEIRKTKSETMSNDQNSKLEYFVVFILNSMNMFYCLAN